MIKKRILYTTIIMFLAVCAAHAQVDPIFLQQTHLRSLYNPATTGKGGDLTAALTTRQQWIGFTGMSTTAIHTHGFINEFRSGFGVKYVMDKYHPTQTQNIKFNYAYYVPFDDIAIFSLGMGVGVMSNAHRVNDYFARDPDDPVIPVETLQELIPDFDFGFEFSTRHFEIGASLTHITYGYNDQQAWRPMRSWYAYSRAKLPMNKYWDFIPGFMWSFNRWQTFYELSAGVRFNNNLCIDLTYRNPMNLGMALGLTLHEGFRIIYSYDYGIDRLMTYNNGSHEITISYTILMNKTYIGNKLRFFKWKMF